MADHDEYVRDVYAAHTHPTDDNEVYWGYGEDRDLPISRLTYRQMKSGLSVHLTGGQPSFSIGTSTVNPDWLRPSGAVHLSIGADLTVTLPLEFVEPLRDALTTFLKQSPICVDTLGHPDVPC